MNYELITGWILDIILGDPQHLPHPVVYMGKWIAMGERQFNRGSHRMLKGALFTITSIIILFATAYGIFCITYQHPYASILQSVLSVIVIFFCLAGHTLRKEVRMVFEAVDRSVEEGRTQVARIVGRDTSALDTQEIRTAALETLAENLSDGVIAPLFWYALLGIPGILTYKLINTFDSMIGYHTERYRLFGCWAARIDDIANYIPARLTALLILIASKILRPRMNRWGIRFVMHYGPQHASPNSGWPEAALASVLDCRFGGPHNYFGEYFYKPFIGSNPRSLTTDDMRISLHITLLTECIAIAIITLI